MERKLSFRMIKSGQTGGKTPNLKQVKWGNKNNRCDGWRPTVCQCSGNRDKYNSELQWQNTEERCRTYSYNPDTFNHDDDDDDNEDWLVMGLRDSPAWPHTSWGFLCSYCNRCQSWAETPEECDSWRHTMNQTQDHNHDDKWQIMIYRPCVFDLIQQLNMH